jgi:hypothetical protein
MEDLAPGLAVHVGGTGHAAVLVLGRRSITAPSEGDLEREGKENPQKLHAVVEKYPMSKWFLA